MLKSILMVLVCATSVQATVLSGSVSEKQERGSLRQTPFFAVNFGGTSVPLGQKLHPSYNDCTFFYIGNLFYVYRGETLMGAMSDSDYRFRSAESMLVSQIMPRPDNEFKASPKDVSYILSLASQP